MALGFAIPTTPVKRAVEQRSTDVESVTVLARMFEHENAEKLKLQQKLLEVERDAAAENKKKLEKLEKLNAEHKREVEETRKELEVTLEELEGTKKELDETRKEHEEQLENTQSDLKKSIEAFNDTDKELKETLEELEETKKELFNFQKPADEEQTKDVWYDTEEDEEEEEDTPDAATDVLDDSKEHTLVEADDDSADANEWQTVGENNTKKKKKVKPSHNNGFIDTELFTAIVPKMRAAAWDNHLLHKINGCEPCMSDVACVNWTCSNVNCRKTRAHGDDVPDEVKKRLGISKGKFYKIGTDHEAAEESLKRIRKAEKMDKFDNHTIIDMLMEFPEGSYERELAIRKMSEYPRETVVKFDDFFD